VDEKPPGIDNLTERQKQILRMIARHHQEKEIARLLNISVPTVKDHAATARRHLGVSSTRKAAMILCDFEAGPGAIPGVGYMPEIVAKPEEDEAGWDHEQHLPSERRLHDHQLQRPGNRLEDAGLSEQAHVHQGQLDSGAGNQPTDRSGESHLQHDNRDGVADIGRSDSGHRVGLTGRLKGMTVVQCLGTLIGVALSMALVVLALLGSVTATVQVIQTLTGQTG
jgi:DNA-binding CsgD family transcriptional regulator